MISRTGLNHRKERRAPQTNVARGGCFREARDGRFKTSRLRPRELIIEGRAALFVQSLMVLRCGLLK